MKVKELVELLQSAYPEADIITSFWNGLVETYTMVDNVWSSDYDSLRSDFFGTPGIVDPKVPHAGEGRFVFIGSAFPVTDIQILRARCGVDSFGNDAG